MRTVYQAPKFQVLRKELAGSDGELRSVEYVRHPGAVVILPVVSDDAILLIRNYRHALDAELWELPAGTLDRRDEPPVLAAARELEEETGRRAGRLEKLCEFYPSPGILDELIHAFVARDLIITQQRLEPLERIVVEEVSHGRALEMIRDGTIRDAKTIVTLLRWQMEG